jgi:hypothetical protein
MNIPITEGNWDPAMLSVSKPSPYVHIAIADAIAPHWILQQETASRFNSSGELNFFHLQGKYRHSLRLSLLLSILERIPTDQVVIMIDAFDVMFNNSIFSIYSLFLEMEQQVPPDQYGRKVSILFNGEKNCWPVQSLKTHYSEQDLASQNPYLNAGIMVGRCDAILDYLRKWDDASLQAENVFWKSVKEGTERSDDQFFWTHAYLHSKHEAKVPRIEIDHDYRLSCCLFNQERDVLVAKEGIVLMRKTGVRPCLLHFNGTTKKAMKSVAEQLCYTTILQY